MENKLLKKLTLKPGQRLLVSQADADSAVVKELGDVVVAQTNPAPDGVLLFAKNQQALTTGIEKLMPVLKPETVFWAAYPKKDSGIPTDLSMNTWHDLDRFGLAPCASVSLDAVWTGIRLKFAQSIKRSGLGNAEIVQNAYGEFIDPVNKTVSLPDDLEYAFAENPAAADLFYTLSYTNRKEYVIWLLSARQQTTRAARLQKTIDKLSAGKKNPMEK
ncbi:YdeI family protein [Pedobacter sp. SYP-B3415]|uniref:YdeI/OmpD-associated family protein n=1 Tax=Pedobacter sp. SYP-B3415 TaxID=2496641 RepID=UPI00101C49A0|nr:YdeI/OmpD-associated family protein [Pedobacter sp. SYP-B3415]